MTAPIGASFRFRFNPRPPRKVGATMNSTLNNRPCCVSILAHLAKWALPLPHGNITPALTFQSSPTSQSGRYQFIPQGSAPGPDVSILAHLAKWALPLDDGTELKEISVFQSSPTSQSGRYGPSGRASWPPRQFQSSPTSQSGRYRESPTVGVRRSCFNPRPPRKVGATVRPWKAIRGEFPVSILAHLAKWALRENTCLTGVPDMFQSSPTSQSGRYDTPSRDRLLLLWFQSSPTSQSGRYDKALVIRLKLTKFQSSPTSQSGRYRGPGD